MTSTTVQVHRVYIKAKPQAIFEAITKPEWTEKYGYGGYFESEPRAGSPYRIMADEQMKKSALENGFEVPDVVIDGEVVELDPPHKLVLTWRMAMDPTAAAEGFTRLTYEIDEVEGGYARLTVIHDLTGAPTVAAQTAGDGEAHPHQGGGGWPWVLSDLKSLLETGTALSR
ncbi:MAG TPA: SRPBCC domain-containing protein [Actinophytocola sp.]|uniref:SRPBCC domain-containing protein n=1 Tax=Actinophytocola sp. TaxID=1872138 RepID=UPI002DDD7526|nr:SRPBCC domain-containing protein [Actinophytocola sp.]HEV2784737.1 SRPBCC domain-containing protein [Actinophytocola sp.]